MGTLNNIMQKVNPVNLLKKKPFNATLITSMTDQFVLIPLDQINDSLEPLGLQVSYVGNGDNCGLLFVDGVRSDRKADDAILLYDAKTGTGYNVYIRPKAPYRYTVYNKQGQVTSTIMHSAGLDSPIIQVVGSENHFKIEGELI